MTARRVGKAKRAHRRQVGTARKDAPLPTLQFIIRAHSPNTYSTVAWRCSLSSGVFMSLALAGPLGPDAIATYCLPLTSNVNGGPAEPQAALTFHSSPSLRSAYPSTVPARI